MAPDELALRTASVDDGVRRILKSGVASYAIGNGLVSAIPLLLLPPLIAILPPADYSKIVAFQVAVMSSAILGGLSIDGSLARDYHRLSQKGRSTYYFMAIAAQTLAHLSLALGVGCLRWAFTNVAGLPTGWLWAAILTSYGQQITSLALVILRMEGRATRFGTVRVAQAVLEIGASAALLLAGWGWRGRVLGMLLTALGVALASATWMAVRQVDRGWRWRRSLFRRMLRFGIPTIGHSGALLCASWVDRVFVLAHSGADQAGVYSVAAQASTAVAFVGTSINLAWAPWLFRTLARTETASLDLVRVARYVILLQAGYVVLGIAATAAVGLALLAAPPDYLAALPVVPVLVAAWTVHNMYKTLVNFLFYTGSTVRLATITASTAGLAVALQFLLAPPLGLVGVALGVLAAQVWQFGLTWHSAMRSIYIPFPQALRELRRTVSSSPDRGDE